MISESIAPCVPNRIRIERIDARKVREEVIALFERKGDLLFRRQFDWYYRDQGQPTPISWLARGGDGRVCGLCSATTRIFRFGDKLLAAGVLGNLIVDRDRRAALVPFALARKAKELVANRELDLLLGIPNQLAEPVLLKMGFHVIARWQSYALVFRSRASLQHRFRLPGRLLSPAADAIAALHRLRSAWPRSANRNFRVVALNEGDLAKVPLESWDVPSSSFVVDAEASYLRWRFLRDPAKKCELFGIADAVDSSICGYVAVEATAGRLHVCDCRTDSRRLAEAEAILCFCHSERARRSTVWIRALQSAPPSTLLVGYGFVRVPESLGGGRAFPLLGFWRPDHPLASFFLEPSRWSVFSGFNDV